MRIKTNERKRSRLVLITLIILLVIIAAIVAFFLATRGNEANSNDATGAHNLNNIDYSPPTEEQKNAARDNNSKTQDPTSPPEATQLTVSFTALNQNESQLQVRVLINEVLGTGTCVLTMTKDGEDSITNSAGLQALASSSTCKGFNVPTTSMAKGNWKVHVAVESNGKKGSAEKEFEIR